ERKGMMKNLLAVLLALPLVAAVPQKASADGGCLNLQGSFRLKICAAGCLKAWCEPFCCAPSGGGCCGSGGYGGGGAAATFNECSGVVPGPWYTYWPYGGQPAMTSPYETPGWVYENNFQLPAPVP